MINLGIGVAAPAAGYALTGNPGVIATSTSYVLGTRGGKSSKVIRNESLSGTIFGTFAHYTLEPMRNLGKMLKAAYTASWLFLANGFYISQDNLIKNQSPKGLYKKLKENYFPLLKRVYKSTGPLVILSSMFVPQAYMVASIAVTSYIFRRFVRKGNDEEHVDKTSYMASASNLAGRFFKNIFSYVYQGAYGTGGALRSIFSVGKPKAAEAPVSHGYMKAPSLNSNKFPSKTIDDKVQYDKNQYEMSA